MENKKKCKACLEEKELSEFYKNSKTRDGLFSKCKLCVENKIKIPKKSSIEDGVKCCTTCGITKELKDFDNCKDCVDKHINNCKVCQGKKKKEYRENNVEKIKENQKNWRDTNKEYKKQKAREWYLKNRDRILEKAKEHYEENKVEIQKYKKEWDILNRDYLNEKERQRKLEDPLFKLTHNIRGLMHQSFKRACKGTYKKSDKTENILGCTIQEFIEHLQSLFTEGMTLENHGNCEECWHIDHKIPISSAKTEEEIIKLNHYTNLQPLWRSDNLSKSNKI